MKILAVNAGSSSLKFQLYEMPEEKVLISGYFEKVGLSDSFYSIKINGEKIKKVVSVPNHKEAVRILTEELINYKTVSSLDEIEGIGHRMVHGGDVYSSSVVINDDVIKTVEELSDLAPLHNPANLVGIRACQAVIPNAKHVGVFDTAFHQTMDEVSFLYSIDYDMYEKYGVRKYGFHGTSHKFVSERMNEILGRTDTKLISCHIGSGASISAIKDGKCIDTSMGFTPNAGIMMGTRSGDIDYSIIPYIMNKTGMSLNEVDTMLNKNSGLAGITGGLSDSRDVEDGMNAGNKRCILAQEMYVKRVVEYIAKYYVLLGGADAIIFTAGLGENSKMTRKQIVDGLSVLGIKLDEERNDIRGVEAKISADDSSVLCYVIPTDEEVMIARDTYNFIK